MPQIDLCFVCTKNLDYLSSMVEYNLIFLDFVLCTLPLDIGCTPHYDCTVRRFYFATAEVRFMFSSSFRKLGLAFNLEYLCQFFINFNNQCQFWNPHDEQITNLSLIFKFNEEITEKIGNEKDEDEINF